MEKYKRVRVLGKGNFGKAYLAENTEDQVQCVVKQMETNNMSEKERQESEREARVLKKMDHPNIIRFHEVFMTRRGRLCIVEEKFPKENFRVNREMRDEIHGIYPIFGRILRKIDVKLQNRVLPKFQILVYDQFFRNFQRKWYRNARKKCFRSNKCYKQNLDFRV